MKKCGGWVDSKKILSSCNTVKSIWLLLDEFSWVHMIFSSFSLEDNSPPLSKVLLRWENKLSLQWKISIRKIHLYIAPLFPRIASVDLKRFMEIYWIQKQENNPEIFSEQWFIKLQYSVQLTSTNSPICLCTHIFANMHLREIEKILRVSKIKQYTAVNQKTNKQTKQHRQTDKPLSFLSELDELHIHFSLILFFP